ncbi:MAG: hypothetical protein SXA11_19595 [Cyanobacteriota bacterium]|nr:hypothetical protein [Cyanobacteriota bacterium]
MTASLPLPSYLLLTRPGIPRAGIADRPSKRSLPWMAKSGPLKTFSQTP